MAHVTAVIVVFPRSEKKTVRSMAMPDSEGFYSSRVLI